MNRIEGEKDRVLYLAFDQEVYEDIFEDISGEALLTEYRFKLIILNSGLEEIAAWIY